MDSKELRGLFEAYSEVYAPQEVDEEQSPIPRGTPMNKRWPYISNKDPEFQTALDRVNKKKSKKKDVSAESYDLYDTVLEFLQAEGYAETLEAAEWLMANVINEEAIGIILGEAITSEKGKAKAAQMIADRSTSSGRAKSGQGGNVALIKHIGRANVDKYMGTPPNPKIAKNPVRSNFSGLPAQGSGNKAARRAAALKNEEFVDEAQAARENPEKYEREQSKKSAPVRGERTPMPPRGDKRREDFEKWYAANVR